YLIWREEFKRVVKEREAELRKLLIMRKNSIDKYKEMLRPLIARYFSFKEEPSIFTSTSLSFIKPATYPLLIESTKLWLIKSIPPFYFEYEKMRQASLSLERIGLILEKIIKLVDKSKEEKIKKIVMPVEPSVDRVVLAGLEVINQKFGTNFSINDVLDIRESIYKKEYEVSPDKERWKLSPYYVFVEISLDRVLLKTYSGIEIEDFAFSIKPYLISQNLAILMYLQTKALDNFLKIDVAIYIYAPLNIAIERLSYRYICPVCGRIYNLKYVPPKNDLKCDLDNSDLIRRADDNHNVIKYRYELYLKESKPIIEYYRARKLLIEIDNSGSSYENIKLLEKILVEKSILKTKPCREDL
ncbi:MAG: hypothetical protein QXX35_01410, partial [Desulfurococcaceae archaeon]